MTMTPREIQEKQFHDAFRGYSHEEVDKFIDEVAEAYETLYKENKNFHRRVEQLQAEVDQSPVSAPASSAAVGAGAAPAVRSDSEDMLKRMLVTAQETADKAVANAKAKAQMLIDEAEIKARRLEEQADSLSSTTLQDAQRRARDLIQTAQQEETELRDRIEGMRAFERDFRTRLAAFVRSQLELLETKPLIGSTSSGPAAAPFFDRSKLLSETLDRFGDFGSRPVSPVKAGSEANPEPGEQGKGLAPESPGPSGKESSVAGWLSESGNLTPEPETSGEPTELELPRWSDDSILQAGSTPEKAPSNEKPETEEQSASLESNKQPTAKKAGGPEAKSIHELFWGEE